MSPAAIRRLPNRFSPYLALLAAQLLAAIAAAVEPASPSVEVKFALRPDRVLDANHRLTAEVADFFGVVKPPVKLRMQFLDDSTGRLHEAGWDIRLRMREGEPDLEVTYKRRYPVATDTLASVLAQAAVDGFDAGEQDYEPQVEWGLTKQTVTFSRERTASPAVSGTLALPSLARSRAIVLDMLPGKLDRFRQPGWARTVLAGAHVYGPVDGMRWRGERGDVDDKIDLEVWKLRTPDSREEPLVEIAFKAKDPAKAEGRRQALREHLRRQGWLLDRDVLKTDTILKRYKP
jgi:hypothetical protein